MITKTSFQQWFIVFKYTLFASQMWHSMPFGTESERKTHTNILHNEDSKHSQPTTKTIHTCRPTQCCTPIEIHFNGEFASIVWLGTTRGIAEKGWIVLQHPYLVFQIKNFRLEQSSAKLWTMAYVRLWHCLVHIHSVPWLKNLDS